MAFVVPAAQNQLLISLNYDATGLEWVDLFDNALIGWAVDENEPQTFEPAPRAIGSLAPMAPQGGMRSVGARTGAQQQSIQSPQWAIVMQGGIVFVPDQYRGNVTEFFHWLAGDSRKVGGQGLVYPGMKNAYDSWARLNTDKVWTR